MNTHITAEEKIMLTCEICIRKIGEKTFLLPLSNSFVLTGCFFEINNVAEFVIKKIQESTPNGIKFHDLTKHISCLTSYVDGNILQGDIGKFVIQLYQYGLVEIA